MRGYGGWLGLVLAVRVAGAAQPAVVERIDWPAFMSRHDLVWERLPQQWHEGAFLGNGLVGTMIWAQPGEALHWDVGRSDVLDRGNRLAIGRFELVPGAAVRGGELRLDLWQAEARGTLRTAAGPLAWRSYTHAVQPVSVVDLTVPEGARETRFVFRQEPAQDARKTHKKEPIPEAERNPPPTLGAGNGVAWSVQPFKAGGGYVVAWGERAGAGGARRFAWTVDAFPPGATPLPTAAAAVVAGALATPPAELDAAHRAWWQAWWPRGFLSIPDTRMESFYWIQLYKLASATRADRPAIDLMGPWFRSTPWPRIWWNLNIQLTYWPVYTGNRLDLGESLVRMLDAGASNLVANVPEPLRGDSAGIGRTSSYDCRGGAGSELGNLTWALHNYWLQYRCSGDEALLRERLYPLLKRAARYMVHNLKPGPDGRLHFPVDVSPEYPERAPDTNYNLALLRWALQVLLATDARAGFNDPAAPLWRQTLEQLAPYPVDPATGYQIGAGVKLAQSHRHFSHLLMFYPLHLVDADAPEARALLERSLDHWIGFEGALQGYSFTGASAMSAWLRRKDAAVSLLGQFLDRYAKANTMYLESGPVIETPLAGAATLHEILLQSATPAPFDTLVRVFPAVPDAWADVTIHNLAAEGAFRVSAARRAGQTRFVRITSLAGAPCRVETGMAQPVTAHGARAFTVTTEQDAAGRPVTVVDLRKGETALLLPAGGSAAAADLVIEPVVAQPERCNYFGSPKTALIRAGADGRILLGARAASLSGEGLLLEKKHPEWNIGGWLRPDTRLAWQLQVDRPGRYVVRAMYASPGGGKPWEVVVERMRDGEPVREAALTATPSATGAWETYKEFELGTLAIAAAGRVTIVARPPAGSPGPGLNLCRLELVPGK